MSFTKSQSRLLEEGTSSFRAELAALLMLLREAPDEEDVVALLDCKSEITEVGKWIGEGAKATLVGVANADILEKIIEKLRARVQAGAATFLVKVKTHRGEPLNEEADDCQCADIAADFRTQTPRSGQTGRKGSYSGGRRLKVSNGRMHGKRVSE